MLSRAESKERSSPTNPISQSLVIKKSLNYFGMESRHHSKKFSQYPLHPLYKFSVVSRSKSETLNFPRSSFTISDNINVKQTLWNIHRSSPFSNSTSLREIILESSLAFNPEPTSGMIKPPYQLNPYQSSFESFEVSDLSISGQGLVSKSIQQARMQTPVMIPFDSRKEATVDTGLSLSSIKSDEVIFNSDTVELSKIEWEDHKEPRGSRESYEVKEIQESTGPETRLKNSEIDVINVLSENNEIKESFVRQLPNIIGGSAEEQEEYKEYHTGKELKAKDDDDEMLGFDDEGPKFSTKDHMFLSDTASKDRLTRKKSVPLFKEDTLTIINDLNSPIIRKIVICQESREGKMVQSRESSVEVKSASILRAVPTSGYLSSLNIYYSHMENKSKASPAPTEKHLTSMMFACSVIPAVIHHSIELLSCGLEHIAMLSVFGKVFTMGYGAGGVLGHGDFVSCAGLRCVDSLFSVAYLECGAYHTAALTEGGLVYTWGRGDVGQLGINPANLTQDELGFLTCTPLPVQDLSHIKLKSIACGQAHTLFLSENGSVFSCGWGDDGQLGFKPSDLQANIMLLTPKQILLNYPVQKISAGSTFSACVTLSGEVLVWGSGAKGQLGLGSKCKLSYLPSKLESLQQEKVIDLTCGENNAICLCRSGKAFAWGLGKVENLGDFAKFPKGSEIVCFVPRQLEEVELAHRIIMIKSCV